MEISEFIEKYFAQTNEQSKKLFIKTIIKKDCYVPYKEKIDMCVEVINASGGSLAIQYVLWTIKLIEKYSTLFISKDSMDDFDLLDKNCLIELIIGCIPEHELEICSKVFEMVNRDWGWGYGRNDDNVE